jgi:hypothetical protein
MPQVDIVRIGDEYFRQYEIAPDDNLSTICFRYGHSKWRDVYDRPENGPFREQFLDPNLIQPGAVSLFVPLPGKPRSGRSVRGRPIEDYFAVHIAGSDGQPIADQAFVLVPPGGAGSEVTTTTDGDFLQSNPPSGDHTLASPTFMLLDQGQAPFIDPVDVTSLPRHGTAVIEAAPPLLLRRNVIMNVLALRMALIVCPMCGRTMRVVETVLGATSPCPNDGFPLDRLLADVIAGAPSFDAPATPPDRKKPRHTPASLLCRGTLPAEATTAGPMIVYWDESRFANPDGDDFTLWVEREDGEAMTVPIVGRHTWGASAPDLTVEARLYEFHEVSLGATEFFPYDALAIPSNETTPLRDVFRWITVHHSAGSATDPRVSHPAVRAIQTKHMVDGVDGDPAADIGYHFVIDRAGTVHEGRALGIKGSHVPFFNGGNVGILLLGNFEEGQEVPTEAMLAVLGLLVDVLSLRFGIQSAAGHRVRERQNGQHGLLGATDCPGDVLIPHVRDHIRSRYPGSGEPVVDDD